MKLEYVVLSVDLIKKPFSYFYAESLILFYEVKEHTVFDS